MAMKVVSWNIRFGEDVAGAIRDLRELSVLRDADIVLLQEMDATGTATIAEAIGMHHAYFSAGPHQRTGRDFGNAVLTVWPIIDAAELVLPHTAAVSGQPRSATRAQMDVNGMTVTAYSVHTEIPLLSLSRRTDQFAALADDVAGVDDGPVVVGGDFNTAGRRSDRALRSIMQRAGLRHASEQAAQTYRRLHWPMRLDHVFARELTNTASGISLQATASDHHPVWSTFDPGWFPRSGAG